MADREYGRHQANDLRLHLTSMLANSPVEVVSGAMVVELCQHGVGMCVAPGSSVCRDDVVEHVLRAAREVRGIPQSIRHTFLESSGHF